MGYLLVSLVLQFFFLLLDSDAAYEVVVAMFDLCGGWNTVEFFLYRHEEDIFWSSRCR